MHADKTVHLQPPPDQALRFSHRRGEREMRVTGDEPQGTMGRVQTVARTFSSRERETFGYEAGSSMSFARKSVSDCNIFVI